MTLCKSDHDFVGSISDLQAVDRWNHKILGLRDRVSRALNGDTYEKSLF
jgi:hypothetical protein